MIDTFKMDTADINFNTLMQANSSRGKLQRVDFFPPVKLVSLQSCLP